MTQGDAQSENEETALPLGSSSLEDIVGALLAGRPIFRNKDTPSYVLANEDARKLFAYYSEHRDLWPRAKTVQGREIEDLLKALAEPCPHAPPKLAGGKALPKLWRLRRVEAHRFGGLHRHCGPKGETPELFVLEIDRDVTLISGFNGAGKTALQSAIMWCLTGRAFRSQHMPDQIHEPMIVEWKESDEPVRDAPPVREISIPPIVPIPSGAELEALADRPKIDTWVQLTFCDEATGDACAVKRSLVTGTKERISVNETGLRELGLTALAIEAGTLMPGIAAHMRFDEKTTFAAAIAQLTGLKPLEDLGRRSERTVKRLKIEEVDKNNSAKAEKFAQFISKRRGIVDAWELQPDLGSPMPLYGPDEETKERSCEASIKASRQHLESARDTGQAATEQILGAALVLNTKQDVEAMLRRLADARDLLQPGALGGLASIATAKNIGAINASDREAARLLIRQVIERAVQTSERLKKVREAARWQLYTRVAAWHKEHHPGAELSSCPVCGADLQDVPKDALLDMGVRDALEKSLQANADASKNAKEWEKDAAREFLEALPDSIRLFVDNAPPASLLAVYKTAYVDELLGQSAFGVQLLPFRKSGANVWTIATEANPLPDPPKLEPTELPQDFANGVLATRLANVSGALMLAEHRVSSEGAIKSLIVRYFGSTNITQNANPQAPRSRRADHAPLGNQIETLRISVESAAPIVSLLRLLEELEKTRKEWQAEKNRRLLLDRAAVAMQSFLDFPSLVHEQVSGLIADLEHGTQTWMKRLYAPHYLGGPSYGGIDPGEERGIGLRAEIGDMRLGACQ